VVKGGNLDGVGIVEKRLWVLIGIWYIGTIIKNDGDMNRESVGRIVCWVGVVGSVISFMVLLFGMLCSGLNSYDTVVGSVMSVAMVNTVGIFSTFGLVLGLLIVLVGLVVKE
jgi:hypothetical protein